MSFSVAARSTRSEANRARSIVAKRLPHPQHQSEFPIVGNSIQLEKISVAAIMPQACRQLSTRAATGVPRHGRVVLYDNGKRTLLLMATAGGAQACGTSNTRRQPDSYLIHISRRERQTFSSPEIPQTLPCLMSLIVSLPTKVPSGRIITGGSEPTSLQAEYMPTSLPY